MISPYKGSGQITREKFLFYEMRTAARLMEEGLSDSDVEERIVEDNLFQYPTEKSIRQMAKTCIRRLHGLQDESLIAAVAAMPQDAAIPDAEFLLQPDGCECFFHAASGTG